MRNAKQLWIWGWLEAGGRGRGHRGQSVSHFNFGFRRKVRGSEIMLLPRLTLGLN